jgi:DNA-binding transcriptional regulator GbsR (MarR family)
MSNHPQSIDKITSDSIAFWCDVADFLGFPRSTGEIFGHYFVTDLPLSADDIAERTHASRSGCGQHIKTLLDIGAIRVSQSTTCRKAHYEMQTDLGILIRRLVNSRMLPKLLDLNAQRQELHQRATEENANILLTRFEKLDRWKQKIEPAAHLIKSLI